MVSWWYLYNLNHSIHITEIPFQVLAQPWRKFLCLSKNYCCTWSVPFPSVAQLTTLTVLSKYPSWKLERYAFMCNVSWANRPSGNQPSSDQTPANVLYLKGSLWSRTCGHRFNRGKAPALDNLWSPAPSDSVSSSHWIPIVLLDHKGGLPSLTGHIFNPTICLATHS